MQQNIITKKMLDEQFQLNNLMQKKNIEIQNAKE